MPGPLTLLFRAFFHESEHQPGTSVRKYGIYSLFGQTSCAWSQVSLQETSTVANTLLRVTRSCIQSMDRRDIRRKYLDFELSNPQNL